MASTRIYLVQHGLAADKALNPERPLTELGSIQTKKIAGHLFSINVCIDRIFHSSKLRAVETAEIFHDYFPRAEIRQVDILLPEKNVSKVAPELNEDNALYVGHLPMIEHLVSYLLCGEETISTVKFRNSGVACLATHMGETCLEFFITPDQL